MKWREKEARIIEGVAACRELGVSSLEVLLCDCLFDLVQQPPYGLYRS